MGKPDIYYDHHIISDLCDVLRASISRSGQHYHGVVGNLNGAMCVAAMLSERSGLPLLDFVRTKRYQRGQTEALGPPVLLRRADREKVANLNVVVAEEVVDEALSIDCVLEHLRVDCGVALVHVATLDFKPDKCLIDGFQPEHVARVHRGKPYIEYSPWEREGANHIGALRDFVEMGLLSQSKANEVISLANFNQPVTL